MIPRTKEQKKVVELSKAVQELNESQLKEIQKRFVSNSAVWNGKKTAYCLMCGERIDSALASKGKCVCPHCGKRLKVTVSKRRKFTDDKYCCMTQKFHSYQLTRYFYVKAKYFAGRAVITEIAEIIREFVSREGKVFTFALKKMPFPYYGSCPFSFYSDLELRNRRWYFKTENLMYGSTYLPELRRNGINAALFRKMNYGTELASYLLKYPKFETLVKAGQMDAVRYILSRDIKFLKDYWQPLKIAIRNNYEIKDFNLWKDYINFLIELKKDTANRFYVCPEDLQKAHDKYHKQVSRKREKEREIEELKHIKELEKTYSVKISSIRSLLLREGNLSIAPLLSVREFYEEGKAMHHCVYDSRYYARENCIILSARINGERAETIELNTKTFSIVQSRGKFNACTQFHKRILQLMKENMPYIKALLKGSRRMKKVSTAA